MDLSTQIISTDKTVRSDTIENLKKIQLTIFDYSSQNRRKISF